MREGLLNDGELILSSFSLFWWSPWLFRCSLWPEIDTPSSSYGKIAALWKLFPKCSEASWNNTTDFAVFPGPQGWQPRIRYLKRDKKKKVLPPFTRLLWIQHNVCIALFCPSAQAGQVDRGSRQFCELLVSFHLLGWDPVTFPHLQKWQPEGKVRGFLSLLWLWTLTLSFLSQLFVYVFSLCWEWSKYFPGIVSQEQGSVT